MFATYLTIYFQYFFTLITIEFQIILHNNQIASFKHLVTNCNSLLYILASSILLFIKLNKDTIYLKNQADVDIKIKMKV